MKASQVHTTESMETSSSTNEGPSGDDMHHLRHIGGCCYGLNTKKGKLK